MTYVVDYLCGWWPVWSMTCVVDDLYGRLPMWSIYTLVEHSTYMKYLPLWYLSTDCLLVEKWDYYFSSVIRWHGVWAVGWMQSSLLLSCADISLVISIGQGYWLDNKSSPSECHRLDDERALSECHRLDNKGLTPASHCYARVMTRWLEVLASYTERLNLTVIMSGMVLE